MTQIYRGPKQLPKRSLKHHRRHRTVAWICRSDAQSRGGSDQSETSAKEGDEVIARLSARNGTYRSRRLSSSFIATEGARIPLR